MQAKRFPLGWFMNGYRVHSWRDQWIGTHKSEGMLLARLVSTMPELQRRRPTRTSYSYEMFRDNLLEC